MNNNEKDRNVSTDDGCGENKVKAANSTEQDQPDCPEAINGSSQSINGEIEPAQEASPLPPDAAVDSSDSLPNPPEPDSTDSEQIDLKSKAKRFFSKKSNRYIAVAAVVISLSIIVLGTTCFHTKWNPATCTEPKTCDGCGKTEGEPLGHDWLDATCTEPETCKRCKKTRGEALGHEEGEWKVVTEATCSNEGAKEMTCPRCKEKITEAIPKLDHQPGEWEVITQPTSTADGTRARKCMVCGAEVERESFAMSPEEIAAQFKSECSSPSYDDVARNPDQFKGSKVRFTGKVIQVMESSGVYTLRVNVTEGRYTWDDTVMIYYISSAGAPRILEDDILTFYGTMSGMTSYESVLGATITLPLMNAQYVE